VVAREPATGASGRIPADSNIGWGDVRDKAPGDPTPGRRTIARRLECRTIRRAPTNRHISADPRHIIRTEMDSLPDATSKAKADAEWTSRVTN
jgi:hypothetical protein